MIKEKLLKDKKVLEKQLYWLELSYNQCKKTGIKDDYSAEEFGQFEILSSRYSRMIDFLVRKIFRTLDQYEFENQGTLVDTVNNAHKRGLFEDIEKLRIMKDLRNTIVHEYIEDQLTKIFEEVYEYSSELIKIIKTTLSYIQKLES